MATASPTPEFIDACLHRSVSADQLMQMAPPELKDIVHGMECDGEWSHTVALCAKTFCLQHDFVFVYSQMRCTVALSVLSKRPQTVRLYCLLYDDGFDEAVTSKAIRKALNLSESKVALNAASVKTARDFVKQLSNRDDKKKTRLQHRAARVG
jgi:hypothetical protein